MKGMIDWFARNEVAANLLMISIIALGLWALVDRIPLEIFPRFERDMVQVHMDYRGATPAEVEKAVVIRVEEAIADLEGIERINSNAGQGRASVQIEIESGLDPRALLDDIKNRVDAISTFPEDVERPIYTVQQYRREVISVAVSGDLPERELRRLGEQVRDDLAALPEVSLVELTGIRPYEIAIEISEDGLDRHNLSFDEIVQAVRRTSGDYPAGAIKTDGGEILLRTLGQAYDAEDFGRITILTQPDGTRLTLADVARISDGFEQEPLNTRLNGVPTVMIEVYRTGDQNALDVGRAVKNYVAQAAATMPSGVTLNYWRDRSRIVKLRLETLLTSAWQGGLLVFLCLTLFLRLSVALWVCVGIPVSFLGALAIMPELGVTLNLLSLFAFILVLGIVVDDAIVTGENIYARLKHGEEGLRAAIRGAQEVAVPVTFGLLTTVAAFLPLAFMGGRRGPMFAQITLIVVPVLLFSWVESKLILPAHMRHIRIRSADSLRGLARLQRRIADGLEDFVARIFQPFLGRALRHRYVTLAVFMGFSIIIVSFVISGRYGFTFFPRVQSETARATLSMQVGTPEQVTARHVERIAEAARRLQAQYTDPVTGESVVRNIMVSQGWRVGRWNAATNSRGRPELGQVSLELIPPEERTLPVTTSELVKEWRAMIGRIPGSKELYFRAEIGRGGEPIAVQLTGQSFEMLADAAADLRARLAQYPGVYDIQDSFDEGKPEIKLTIRPEAELLGLTAQDLGRQVRQAFFGAEAQRIQRDRDDVRVMVRYPEEQRRSLDALERMRIRTADGAQVPIANVADVRMGEGFANIHRVDRQRAVDVSADADKKNTDVNRIAADLQGYLAELSQRYPGLRYTLEGELREQKESFGSLFYGTLFALFVIYALLAIPLRSYAEPLIVMLVIPFSIVGALLGHMIMDASLSLMSLMGMLALGGVVVNDSLVLVDWINRRLREGLPLAEAVRRAGAARFRPIMLTSLTTFAGLGPLLLEKSTQAQFLIPMAISLGFGILYATLLSLILVPVGFMILDDLRSLFHAPSSEDAVLATRESLRR